jgi:predicted transcriptional regulator
MSREAADPSITDSESVIMEVLWRRHPPRTEEVVASLYGDHRWQAGTIKALVNRLLRKGAIRAERDGRRFLYSPLISRDRWLLNESKGLLDRLFSGRVAPLAAHFSRHGKLTRRDIADLKRLLDDLEHGK